MSNSTVFNTGGAHASISDPRNDTIKIYVNGDIVPRNEAKVSVYDSGFMLGDGIWEGIGTLQETMDNYDKSHASEERWIIWYDNNLKMWDNTYGLLE